MKAELPVWKCRVTPRVYAAVKSGEGFGCQREEVARKYYQIAVPSVMERKQEAVCWSDLYTFIKQLHLSCMKCGFLCYLLLNGCSQISCLLGRSCISGLWLEGVVLVTSRKKKIEHFPRQCWRARWWLGPEAAFADPGECSVVAQEAAGSCGFQQSFPSPGLVGAVPRSLPFCLFAACACSSSVVEALNSLFSSSGLKWFVGFLIVVLELLLRALRVCPCEIQELLSQKNLAAKVRGLN